MTVYVDDSNIQATVPNGTIRHTSRWSHLFADTQAELHAFAARINLRRSWFQGGAAHGDRWHYDVTARKRDQAIRAGAVAVTWREAVEIRLRREGRLPISERRRAEVDAKYPVRETP